jgi:dihydrolipoamide dehydrogenase
VFERVLIAAGRPPNLAELNLGAAGLALDDDGVPHHDPATRRCGESAVFIAGDAARDLPVLHEASRQRSRAGRNVARLSQVEAEPPPPELSIVFTDPDMAAIGKPLSALGKDAVVGCCDFAAGRALIEDRPGGIIRLYAQRGDGVIMGGERVGAGVEHLAHAVAFMIQQRLRADLALRLPFYHPTYEENLKNCPRDLSARLAV